eukprot:6177216-Pleurochrysis_carterae.AAC.3
MSAHKHGRYTCMLARTHAPDNFLTSSLADARTRVRVRARTHARTHARSQASRRASLLARVLGVRTRIQACAPWYVLLSWMARASTSGRAH